MQVKRIFQLNNPDRKYGGDRKSGEYQKPDAGFWYDAIVARSGWGRSVLEEAAKIGKKIDAEAADLLWGSLVADNQRELVALIEYGPDLQRAIAEKIAADEAKTVAQAAALVAGAPEVAPEPMPVEKQVGQITKVLEKISDDAKRAWVEVLREEGWY
ncbi:hypothetical protein [Profundibacter sp.]